MQRIGTLTVAICASLMMLVGAHAQDSSDLFLSAYQDFQTAEKLEREGKPREALDKYQDANKALMTIRKESPDWQPPVVEYRLKKTQEGITRLQSEVASLPPPVESIEGELPRPDRETSGPSVSTGPQVIVPRGTPSRPAPRETYEPRTGSSTLDREIRQLRQQLEEAKSENRRLGNKLEKQTGELQGALTALDRAKVSLVEEKARNAQVAAALENAERDGMAKGSLQAEFDRRAQEVIAQLSAAQSNVEVLEEENARLLAKLEQASTYIGSSDAIREGLLGDRKKLESERNDAVAKAKKVKDNSAEIEKLAGRAKELEGKLAESEKLAKAKSTDADTLLQENKALTNKLAEALINSPKPGTLEKLAAQRDALAAERTKLSGERDALTAERDALQKKIADLEKSRPIEPAATPDPAKDRQIAALQSELNSVSDRLLEAQGQVSQGDERVRDLQKQLDQATGELAQLKINPTPSKEETHLIAENELLRNIILRQIKEQTRRDEAVKAVETVIASAPGKMEGAGPHLAVLREPALKLTDEERQLFRDPVSLLTQPDGADSLSVAVAVAKPGAEGKKQEEKPAGNDPLPEAVRGQFEQAKKLFEKGDFAGAEKVFQEIVEAVPDNYYILANLGAVQIESGKLSAAEVALKKAIQINDADSYAHCNLGIVYCRQGKIDAAIDALRRSVSANEKDPVAHNYLGVCLGQKEEREAAEKAFKRAIAIDPDYAAAHFNLAVLYATTQPPAMALAKQHYSKATQLGAPPDASLERLIQ